ncbi:MAG: hemin uptake protein HemP [Pseudomonadota bacterium]
MTAILASDDTPDRQKTDFKPLKLTSAQVLQGLRRVIIDHEGTEYTLHLTKQNKLLLTK